MVIKLIEYSIFVMCFYLTLQCVWRRIAKSAVRNQTNVSNANVATKRTRRDSAVSSCLLHDNNHLCFFLKGSLCCCQNVIIFRFLCTQYLSDGLINLSIARAIMQ